MPDFWNALYQSLSPLWEMSVTAAYTATIIIVLRLLLKNRAPKQVFCLLWLVVFVRLLLPVSLESPLSIVPDALPGYEQVQPGGKAPNTPADHKPGQPQSPAQGNAQGQPIGTPVISSPGEPSLTIPGDVTPATPAPEPPASFPWQAVAAGVWLAGALAMGGYGLFSYLRLRRRLFDAIRAKDGAWEHPDVDSPFILGMLRPRIYLPAGLVGRPRMFILCHERAHLRRLDHIIKPVCWVALALHWFNPLVWAAYILMSRDIEAACDEAVIRRLGSEVKADYSTTLLALATGRRAPSPCPLAFDEGDAKGRIQNVLRYRRPALWVIVVSAVMAVLAAVCLLTDPVAAEAPEGGPAPSPAVSAAQPPEQSPAPAQPPEDIQLDPWMREVLDGEQQFIPARPYGDTHPYTIHDLRSFFYGDDNDFTFPVTVGRVAIIDLDKDGVNELVIWPEGGYEYLYSVVGYGILRRQGDEVYAYNPGYRTFGSLKSDGSFHWSSSAAEHGEATLTFGEDDVILHDTTYQKPAENGIDLAYFVDGRKATEEEYDAAMDREYRKPQTTWFTYADGQLQPYLPYGAKLSAQSQEGSAKLWQEDSYPYFWLEWNGLTWWVYTTMDAEQQPYPFVKDFDGDGQDEIVIQYFVDGFPHYDIYEWNNGALTFADTFDSEDLLLRFNQNNVAACNKDSRGLTVTYAHTEGDPDSENYYRHYVSGSCTLPEDFFNGYEHIRDGYTYAYANQFHLAYFQSESNAYYFDFDIYLADETMKDLASVDYLLNSDYSFHYMVDQPVGMAYFLVRYDGSKWVVQEADQLNMDFQDNQPTPMDIASAAPLSAPVADLMNGLPDDPEEWYKVAELPDDMIWVYARNYGTETLIRWDGNFYKTFDRTAHAGRAIPPALKKLGGGDAYGPLAIISNTGSGSGVSLFELAVYDLDSPDAPCYVHDWSPLRDEFNGGRTFRYDKDAHTITTTYQGQTAELIIDGGDNEELYRRIDEEGIRLAVTGEIVSYRFNEDGTMEIEFPLQAFIGDDVVGYPLLWPWFLRWTIRFNGAGFETVPGSCRLFTYARQ